jgi:hypothetical protein
MWRVQNVTTLAMIRFSIEVEISFDTATMPASRFARPA